MANPVFTDLTADTWTKVATNVVSGIVHKVGSKPSRYLQTYKATGDPAPTLASDGVTAFFEKISEQISAPSGIDVYIYAEGDTGRVRVDV